MQLLSDEQFRLLDKVLKSYAYHDSDHVPHATCGGVERLYNQNRELSEAEQQAKWRQAQNQEVWIDVPAPLPNDALVVLRLALRSMNARITEVLHSEYGFRGFFKKKPSPQQLMRRRGSRYNPTLWTLEVNRAMSVLWSQLKHHAGDKFDVWFGG
ncbi:hypothetical protein ADP71_31640 [Vitreoscilla sp. C1]|uniref:hypothetical protein n=1 Tax=Vitreoscilla sp. (strain C1) TaxID=96942 RepID=UPI000CDBC463|nr:hypothetical protein [Vitreoscilla sp. C1]AUZ06342.1 hypothetical protein ADP71_31640 [Vitreoscilla sp. C1]